MIRSFEIAFLIVAMWLFAFPTQAHAYLDPASGSMVIQVTIGSILSLLAILKMYWKGVVRVAQRVTGARHTDAAHTEPRA